jgi:hypothetical protein
MNKQEIRKAVISGVDGASTRYQVMMGWLPPLIGKS